MGWPHVGRVEMVDRSGAAKGLAAGVAAIFDNNNPSFLQKEYQRPTTLPRDASARQ
jgi:hypothetical protein